MTYRLTRAAEEDIILAYVEGVRTFGVDQAEAYHAKLERTFEILTDNPRLARERVEFSLPVRVHPCGAHMIVYTVDESDDVLVLRVRHGKENWVADLT